MGFNPVGNEFAVGEVSGFVPVLAEGRIQVISGFPTENKVVFFGEVVTVVKIDYIVNSNKTGADFGGGSKVVSVGFFQIVIFLAFFNFRQFGFLNGKEDAIAGGTRFFGDIKSIGR